MVGIICGPIWGSFAVRDYLRFNFGIICGPGSFAVPGSFCEAVQITLEEWLTGLKRNRRKKNSTQRKKIRPTQDELATKRFLFLFVICTKTSQGRSQDFFRGTHNFPNSVGNNCPPPSPIKTVATQGHSQTDFHDRRGKFCPRRRRELLAGLGASFPRKFWNLEALKCCFQLCSWDISSRI